MRFFSLVLLVFLLAFSFLSRNDRSVNDSDPTWSQIDSLERLGKYRSALELTEVILEKAWEEKDRENYLKAVVYRIKYVHRLYRDEPLRIINFIEGEIDRCGPVVSSILYSILGEYYMFYLQSRRHTISSYTEVEKVDEEDVDTWTRGHFLKKADEAYLASLESKATAEERIETLGEIVSGDSLGRARRPNVRHLLQSRAIKFYQFANHRQSVALPEIIVNSPEFFYPVEEFIKHDFGVSEKDQPDFSSRTVLLLQDILREALENGDRSVLADLDLGRYSIMESLCQGAKCESIFREALARGVDQYADTEVQAEFLNLIGRHYLNRAGDYRAEDNHPAADYYIIAREYAKKAVENHPGSYGAAMAKNLISQIEEIDFSFQMDEAVPLDTDFLVSLDYRNIDKIQLRVFRISREDQMAWRQHDGTRIRAEIELRDAVEADIVSLPNDGNHHRHRVEVPMNGLSNGIYILTANLVQEDQEDNDNIIKWSYFQSSNLAYFNQEQNHNLASSFVVHRVTGEPIEGVEVTQLESRYDRSQRRHYDRTLGIFHSSEDGRVDWPEVESTHVFTPRLVFESDTLYGSNTRYTRMREFISSNHESVDFCLDRAIYRPGQRVYFKGLLSERDGDVSSKLSPGEDVEVLVRDANRKVVQTIELRTNKFGAFYGSFTAPEGILGRMTISLSDRARGSTSTFRVEEYKRPTWFAELDEMIGEYRPGDTIEVSGNALAYAGFPVSGASVEYRVHRTVSAPWWYRSRFYFPPSARNEIEIAHGETITDSEGNFNLSFEAARMSDIEDCVHCVYQYNLSLVLTDEAGESTSLSKSISVSDNPVKVDVNLPRTLDDQGAVSGQLRVRNLDGVPLDRKLKVSIQKLQDPDRIPLPRKWRAPTHHLLSKEDFKNRFPLAPYKQEYKFENWERKDLLLSRELVVSGKLNISFTPKFPAGVYILNVIDLESKDSVLLYSGVHQLVDFVGNNYGKCAALSLFLEKKHYQPGETALIRRLSHLDLSHLLIVKELKEGETDMRWTVDKGTLPVEIKEENRGGMHVTFTGLTHNHAFTQRVFIPVPFDNKNLSVKPVDWDPNPAPGSRQTWRFQLFDKEGNAVQANVLVSMYDKSLDEFVPNNWSLSPFRNRRSRVGISTVTTGSISSRGFFRIVHPGIDKTKNYPDLISWLNHIPGLIARSAGHPEAAETREMLAVEYMVPLIDPSAEEEEQLIQMDETVRENFDETVFFYPDLRTDENGVVEVDFEMGEALTSWKFQILGLTEDLCFGIKQLEVTTSKDFIVLPNWPRFFMHGDKLGFPVRLVNNSEDKLELDAAIVIEDAITGADISGEIVKDQSLKAVLDPGASKTVFFDLSISREIPPLIEISVAGQSGDLSDGERRLVAVHSSDIWITRTFPFYLRQGEKLVESIQLEAGVNPTMNQTSFEYSSDPFWLAIQSLPFSSSSSARSAGQFFEQYYMNAMAGHLLEELPDLKTHLRNWVEAGGLQSELMKNRDLKISDIEETPWLRAALLESESREKLAELLNPNTLDMQLNRSLRELRKLQRDDGGFSWFPNGPANWFISQRILTGFASLHQYGVGHPGEGSSDLVRNAVSFSEEKAEENFERFYKSRLEKEENGRRISPVVVQYLFVKSQLEPWATESEHWEAFYSFAKKDWPELSSQLQGMLGEVFHVHGDSSLALTVAESLLERTRFDEAQGRWLIEDWSYHWFSQRMESHTYLISLLDRIGGFDREIEEIRQWLLNRRRTTNWGSNSATARVIQSLLTGRETDDINLTHIDDIKINGTRRPFSRSALQSGTGWFRENLSEPGEEIKLEIENTGSEISWGAVYHQYFQDISQVEKSDRESLPIEISREWMVKRQTDRGETLVSLEEGEKLMAGQRLVGRIVLKADRDMEYIHLKDMRPSALEPGNVLSGYRWSGGLSYYLSSRDAVTEFFIQRLPRGTYVLEYETSVSYTGKFNAGLIQAQSYFAPEFSVYGKGGQLEVIRE
ncbi:MAG: hypothetical protein EA411_01790 [Saprospirales bacterium]|nr:MAG: hypothetical protein EA411_01790 [Saprospirales bacterium]